MKRELRGRRIRDYDINYIVDLRRIMEPDGNIVDEDIKFVNREYGCDISGISDKEVIIEHIRQSILEMYNDAITPSVMLLYSFLIWYKKTLKRLERLGKIEKCEKLLDFKSVLNSNVISKLGALLSQKYDRDNADEYINHSKYKMISMMKARIIASDKSDLLDKLEKNIDAAIHNCYYLHFIDDEFKVDNYYLLRWEYYPVDKVFRDVINTFDSEINRPAYEELKGKEFFYFNKIKKSEVDFSSIKSLNIIKDGKRRQVYIANKAIDQAALIYLAKRLNNEFKISYPNRDKIMELSFNLIDSLPRLDNYTIYKFDFKDFFDSVDIKSIYNQYLEHSNLYSYEKELVLKIAKKYKNCVQGLPTSNALIEIVSREFDERVKAAFSEDGLVFYKRYVDDCILIFNHRVKREVLNKAVDKCRRLIFGGKIKFSSAKTSYQTKLDGDETFDYLGYSFTRCYWDKTKKENDHYYYFKFGIATQKIEKYKKQLDAIFNTYERDKDERLLLRRIQYYDSRIVFYNYDGSKYVNKSIWDVRGIINSYRMLRRYVIFDEHNIKEKTAGIKNPYRIQKETFSFLQYYVKKKRDDLSVVPQYLQGKGCFNHNLWKGFLNNRSIVFQSNIGWSNALLSERLIEIGGDLIHKSYYEKTRDYYSLLIKEL